MPRTYRGRDDVRSFLAQQGGQKSRGVHSPKLVKRLAWPVCSRCGLIYLKNDATAAEARKACVVEED